MASAAAGGHRARQQRFQVALGRGGSRQQPAPARSSPARPPQIAGEDRGEPSPTADSSASAGWWRPAPACSRPGGALAAASTPPIMPLWPCSPPPPARPAAWPAVRQRPAHGVGYRRQADDHQQLHRRTANTRAPPRLGSACAQVNAAGAPSAAGPAARGAREEKFGRVRAGRFIAAADGRPLQPRGWWRAWSC